MADYRAVVDVLRFLPMVLQHVGRTEPDLRLIKQVEQVTCWFGRTSPALCQDFGSMATTGTVEILVCHKFSTYCYDVISRKIVITASRAEGNLFRRCHPAMPGP